MKKILVIDESPLFRQYLKEKLAEYSFEVIPGINGLDGMVKLRTHLPELVIMDYYLSRLSSLELLKQKAANANTAGIPVIMISSGIEREKLLEMAGFNVKKFFAKPLKLDALLKGISEILGVKLAVDATPCILEAHFNEEILFIEVARGLNREMIELLKYKITELLELYQKRRPKVLIMMSDLTLVPADADKLAFLLDHVLEATGSPARAINILTVSPFVKEFVAARHEYESIGLSDNLSQAMDGLMKLKVSEFISEGQQVLKQDLLKQGLPVTCGPGQDKMEMIQLRFEREEGGAAPAAAREVSIAVVDDDLVIQELVKTTFERPGWKVTAFGDGQQFVASLEQASYDLVLLDLLMPRMNGFEVLQHLRSRGLEVPIIVLSALSQKETVMKVIGFGIKTYMIKPLKPELILRKTVEILRANF